MTPRDTLAHLVASSQNPESRVSASTETQRPPPEPIPIRLLRTLEDAPQPPQSLANQTDIPRQRVYRVLDPLDSLGVVDHPESMFRLTGTGVALLAAYTEATATITPETIGYLGRSTHRGCLLHQLADGPVSRRELSEDPTGPSDSTIRRSLRAFEERGWLTRTPDNLLEATKTGRRVAETFQWLVDATEQILAADPFLRRLGDRSADLPFTALTDAELVVATPENPHAPLSAAIDHTGLRDAMAGDETIDHIKTVCPVFSPAMFDVFGQVVDLGTDIEIVFDAEVRKELSRKRNLHYLAGAVAAPNLEVRFLSETLTYGVGIYDDTGMAVAYTDREGHEAGIATQNEALLEWIDDQFTTYWERGEGPSEYVRNRIRRYFDDEADSGSEQRVQ
jgi:predicted transcriptional regulator